jgi:hypothetical protein
MRGIMIQRMSRGRDDWEGSGGCAGGMGQREDGGRGLGFIGSAARMAIASLEGTSSVGDHLQISRLGPFLVILQASNRAKCPMGMIPASGCVRVGAFCRLDPPGVVFAWPEAMIRVQFTVLGSLSTRSSSQRPRPVPCLVQPRHVNAPFDPRTVPPISLNKIYDLSSFVIPVLPL